MNDTTTIINPAMEKAATLLEQLSVKLGVTSDKIWEMTMAQSDIIIIKYIVVAIIAIVSTIIVIKYVSKLVQEENDPDNDVTEGMVASWIAIAVITGISTIITFISTLYGISTFLTCLMNPSYWAYGEIMELLVKLQ